MSEHFKKEAREWFYAGVQATIAVAIGYGASIAYLVYALK